MSYKVAALYQFVTLPDAAGLREPMQRLCADHGLVGTILIAREGINGTVAGSDTGIDGFVAALVDGQRLGLRFDGLELKISRAAEKPFKRLKVRLKKEIVTLGEPAINPAEQVGTYVAPSDWNALLEQPGVTVIDTRNAFEVAMGSFVGAVDPGLAQFSDFRAFVADKLDPTRDRRVAMFCTGGIRCEKASAYLLAKGFEEVYHLKGGILKYLEEVPEARSRWVGSCFVFDERVALGHGLVESGAAAAGQSSGHDGSPEAE